MYFVIFLNVEGLFWQRLECHIHFGSVWNVVSRSEEGQVKHFFEAKIAAKRTKAEVP